MGQPTGDAALGLERGKVRLVPYQSVWPELFEAEAARLRFLAGPALERIEHVGSTAISRMDSKPIVDLMACVLDMPAATALIPLFESNGYEYRPDDSWPERVFLARGPRIARTHHLSLTVQDSTFWADHLLFRDYLRENPPEVFAYCALKRDLARRFPDDRRAYTDAKKVFVRRVLLAARGAI
ncbi:GrpB family protein [Polaromonas sp.]|uniref:GrpB family protein n=1 Tax=Polaromonas sp. TaxID=1869339 RepID=UPI003267F833